MTSAGAPKPGVIPIAQRNVSKRLVQPGLRYLDDTAGPAVTDRILADLGVDRLYFEDVDGFMPLEMSDRLFVMAARHTGDAEYAYHVGRSLARYLSRTQAALTGVLLSPGFMYANMGRIERNVVRTTRVDARRLGRNRFRLTVTFSDGYREPRSACRNRHGTYEAIPVVFGLPFATVTHPQCAFRGDPHCTYDVTVPEHPYHWLQRIAIALACLSGAFALLSVLFWGHRALLASGAALNLALYAFLSFQTRRTRHVLEWARETHDAVEAHTLGLKQEYERTRFLHDLTVELTRHLDPAAICERVTASLRESFGYATCQAWLVDDGLMRCVRAEGLPEAAQAALSAMVFSIDEGLRHSGSFIARVLGKRETLLVDDPAGALGTFSPATRDLLSSLRPSSAILVPLLDKEQPVGMLVATHAAGAKVSYVDRLLFEAAAPVVSNALERARLYADLQRRVRERGEEIGRQQQALMDAREMAIRSEKLSALGRMSAGIAHEINNPLNFLVNVAPDLRSDTQALTRILHLGQEALAGSEAGRRLARVVDEGQLVEHLREGRYVFDTIARSLDKAKRVVNGLRVFSRVSSLADTPTRERVRDLVAAATDLIPETYRTSVAIRNEVDPAHAILAGRNQVIQVLLSLLQNALEAIAGRGTVTLRSAEVGGMVEVSVSDSGSGIEAAALGRVFEPFFTTKARDQHTGLGLTVAEEIVRRYGGEIRCENGKDAGAVFTVRLRAAGEPP